MSDEMHTDGQAVATANKSAGGADTGLGQRNQYTDDTSRVSDFDKDTGTDERFEVETADRSGAGFADGRHAAHMARGLDIDALTYRRGQQSKTDSQDSRTAEQTLLHQAKLNSFEVREREQSFQHREDQHQLRMRAAERASILGTVAIGDVVEEATTELAGMILTEAVARAKSAATSAQG